MPRVKHKPGKKKKIIKRLPEPSSYLIASEGTKTEVFYFEEFKKEINTKYNGSIESYVIEIKGIGKETIRVIEEINEFTRYSPIIYENIWAVFDKDDFPEADFDNAISKAENTGIKVAWSNECFELWYLLHFSYCQSALKRNEIERKLNAEFIKLGKNSGYDKVDPENYHYLKPLTSTAIRNANKLLENMDAAPSKTNPATKVHLLVIELLDILNK